ncbi:MAG: hypothetical protein U0694_05845 [Anaerolineae bacterium]
MTFDNPYRPAADDGYVPAPFAGRQQAFTRIYGYLSDVERVQAFALVGRRQIGKTAFLWQFDAVFGDTYVGVFVPMEALPLRSEGLWLAALARQMMTAIARREYTLSRVPEIPNEVERVWFANEFLPAIYHAIRPHRRLVLLLDNAHLLIDPIARGDLPPDTFDLLAELLQRDAQLAAVLTLDAEREQDMPAMQPLVGEIHRLGNLTQDECTLLLPEGAPADAVYKATAGQPALVQRFAYRLLQNPNAKAASAAVYASAQNEFRDDWQRLTRNERLILTAVSSLLYADPLRGCEADAISKWLVETDYPLDITAINAALRSLEYREILTHDSKGYVPAAGLMQRWLLENARLESAAHPPTRRRWWLVALVAALVFAALLLFIALSGSTPSSSGSVQPTVTLVGTP